MDRNTGKQCVQEGKHRNAMSEHGTGTGTRIRTGTGTGTKLETVILRSVLVIPEFERGTKFRESRESVQSCDSGASRADEFRGGTSAGGVTGDVTGLELSKVYQQSHVSVTGCNRCPQSWHQKHCGGWGMYMLTLHVTPWIAILESMAALAAFLDLKLSMRGPLPVLLQASWLLTQTIFASVKSIGATSVLEVSILVMASCNTMGLLHICEGTLWTTTAYVRCRAVALGSISFTQPSICALAH